MNRSAHPARAWLGNGPAPDGGAGGGPAGFDFTLHMRRLCEDLVARVEELRHIDMGWVAVGFSQARKAADCGRYATLTPLRFPGGAASYDPPRPQMDDPAGGRGRPRDAVFAHLLLAAILDLPLVEKRITVVHELWHIGPKFDGDLRRFRGRCYAHSGSQRQYDARVKQLVDRWLELGPPAQVQDFLTQGYRHLVARHGAVYGRRSCAESSAGRVKSEDMFFTKQLNHENTKART